MIRFQDLRMSHEAKNKWKKSTIDDKMILEMAFSDVIKRPELVGYYDEFSATLSGLSFEFFIFRIGYAAFFLMMIAGFDEFIVLDFGLQDGESARIDVPFVPLPLPAPPPP